jgi:isopenicillin-N epimerase
MSINRREFLTTVGSSLAATSVLADEAKVKPVAAAVGSENLADWSAVRAQFNLAPQWLHFSQFFFVSHPRPVREAIERYRRALDANPFETVEVGMGFATSTPGVAKTDSLPMRVRHAVAEYIGGQPEDIALTDSTTLGLALIYNGLTLKAGDEILTTTHDHMVHHESIRFACERSSATWRKVPLYDDPRTVSVDETADRLRRALQPHTRIVGLTWVHSCTGVKLPIQTLSKVIAEANRNRAPAERVLLVLDAVHGFGNQDMDLTELGCDFAAAGTHKWIFAPRGTGIIWAPKQNWGLLRPTVPSFSSPDLSAAWKDEHPPAGPTQASWVTPGGFKAYEHQWAMTEAFEFHRRIGRKRIADRIAALNTACKDGLAQIPRVKVLTPREPALSAGIICFEVEGRTPASVVQKLRERNVIASTSPYKITHARLAPSIVNNEREVEAAVMAVAAIA